MEKHIEVLLANKKTWEFAVITFQGKGQVMVTSDTDIAVRDNPEWLEFKSLSGHPAPPDEAIAKLDYDMLSYVKIDTISGIDFYKQKRILTAK